MCESIESYANERAEYARIDECIDTCIHFNHTKEEITEYVTSKFEKVSDSYIIERVTLLWNQKKGE